MRNPTLQVAVNCPLANVPDVLGEGRRRPFGRNVEPCPGLHAPARLEGAKRPCRHEVRGLQRCGVTHEGRRESPSLLKDGEG